MKVGSPSFFTADLSFCLKKETPETRPPLGSRMGADGLRGLFPLYLRPFCMFKLLFTMIMTFIRKENRIKRKEKLNT